MDAFAFLQIDQIPHTRLLDRFMTRLSWVMTGGAGWLLFLLLATLMDRQLPLNSGSAGSRRRRWQRMLSTRTKK